jgi:RHH-type proline utilization regulon transcriptional repressor/proline dehydrogenase/delta 1-pyrroline-5-carboxylate dehydrogenase
VPDPETADQLIADKLGDADWKAHAGQVAFDAGQFGDLGLVIGRGWSAKRSRPARSRS